MASVTSSSRHAGLLGTVVEVTVTGRDDASNDAAHRATIAEIERLQQVFTVFDETSDLRRWQRGDGPPSPELAAVLTRAESWRRRSGGAFDPAAAAFTVAWDRAAAAGREPTDAELREILDRLSEADRPTAPLWLPPPVPYALNAIAKGWIVDRAVDAVWPALGLSSVIVNAGGDLVHRGARSIVIGIEDPARPYDNVPPLLAVRLGAAALATSGGARRGWTIAGAWYPHVIDPRSGRTVAHHASCSVIAPDAATADVVATIVGVQEVDEAVAFVDALDQVAACIVAADGRVHRSQGWADLEVKPGS